MEFTPNMLKWKTQADANSLFNTPPCYGIYICGKVFKWLKAKGGLEEMKKINEKKAAILYDFLDNSKMFKGKKKKWWRDQTLYWQGKSIKRDSDEYQDLLDKAFSELSKNEGFKKALLATGSATLTHSIGKNDLHKTVLTQSEFCRRLTSIREQLKEN